MFARSSSTSSGFSSWGIRGIYGWKVNTLVDAALATVAEATRVEDMRRSLTSFLNRVYYDLRNLGQTWRDRALNFAATNAFQAASVFAEAIADGLVKYFDSPLMWQIGFQ